MRVNSCARRLQRDTIPLAEEPSWQDRDFAEENVPRGEAWITDLHFLTLLEPFERRDQIETWSHLYLDFVVS